MKIGLNALHYLPGTLGGGETYLINLLKGLARIEHVHEVELLTNPSNHDYLLSLGFDCHLSNFRAESRPIRVAYEQLFVPYICRKRGYDVFHTTANVIPVGVRCPSVLTIHDLRHCYYPEIPMPKGQYHYYRIGVPMSAVNCTRIITVSDFVANDIVQNIGVDREKISVIYEASKWELQPEEIADKEDSFCSRYGIVRDYVLTIGNELPHKNIGRVIEAMSHLQSMNGMCAQSVSLVIVGDLGRSLATMQSLAEEIGVGKKVLFVGRLSDSDLKSAYRNAALFVFPSLMEGFGLPVLEAMELDVPVLASDATSLPEIAGGAALLVDATKPDKIARKICEVFANERIRDKLISLGRKRAAEFSWERAAKETVEVYESVAS